MKAAVLLLGFKSSTTVKVSLVGGASTVNRWEPNEVGAVVVGVVVLLVLLRSSAVQMIKISVPIASNELALLSATSSTTDTPEVALGRTLLMTGVMVWYCWGNAALLRSGFVMCSQAVLLLTCVQLRCVFKREEALVKGGGSRRRRRRSGRKEAVGGRMFRPTVV